MNTGAGIGTGHNRAEAAHPASSASDSLCSLLSCMRVRSTSAPPRSQQYDQHTGTQASTQRAHQQGASARSERRPSRTLHTTAQLARLSSATAANQGVSPHSTPNTQQRSTQHSTALTSEELDGEGLRGLAQQLREQRLAPRVRHDAHPCAQAGTRIPMHT